MTPDLDGLFKHYMAFATKALMRTGRLYRTFVLIGETERTILVDAIGGGLSDNPTLQANLMLMALATDAKAAIVMCEAWALTGPEPYEGVQPSSSERRTEVLSVIAFASDRTRSSLCEILRDATGTISGFGPDLFAGWPEVQELMTNLLAAPRDPEMIAEARELVQLLAEDGNHAGTKH